MAITLLRNEGESQKTNISVGRICTTGCTVKNTSCTSFTPLESSISALAAFELVAQVSHEYWGNAKHYHMVASLVINPAGKMAETIFFVGISQ